jgi:hypothetical protein
VFDPSKSKNWKALSGYTWLSNTPTRAVRLELSVSGQAVEIAMRVSSSFIADTAKNGPLGRGSSSLNTGEIPRSVSSLSSPVFTADLMYHAPGMLTLFSFLRSALLTEMYSGTYDFGFIDSLKYTGTITYITIDSSSGNWGFTGSGYAVGSSSFVSYSIDAGYVYIYSSHSPFLHNISPVLTPEHRFCSFRTLSLRPTESS